MTAKFPLLRARVARWLEPAPDSDAAFNVLRGYSPWVDLTHLLWSVWIFIVPVLNDGYSWAWLWTTLASYPVFLLAFTLSFLRSRRYEGRFGMAVGLLSLLMAPWNPGAAFTYFTFGCVMSRARGARASFNVLSFNVLQLLLLTVAFTALTYRLGYPWQTVMSLTISAVVICGIVGAFSSNAKKDTQLRMSHDEVRRLAATAERERIGRDLHDLLGHTLSLITLKLELSRRLHERGDVAASRHEADEAERVARHALAEVRSAVTGIRHTDIVAELASAKLLLEASGVTLTLGTLPGRLPVHIERGLALILREAVTNVSRHAGASMLSIAFKQSEHRLDIELSDNGRGGIQVDGNGLAGMRERVAALGGSLAIASPRGRGSCLSISLPLNAAEPSESAVRPPSQASGTAVDTSHSVDPLRGAA